MIFTPNSNPVYGKSLDLAVTVSTDQIIYQNTFNLSLAIGNPNEEKIYKIETVFFFPDFFYSNDIINIEELEPNSYYKETVFVSINETSLAGIYPIVILFKYQNKNNDRFSKLVSHLIAYKMEYSFNITGYITYLEIEKGEEKETAISIINLDNKPHDIVVTLILPDELGSTFSKEIITVDSLSKSEFKIPIHAKNETVENNYLAIASLEYEYENVHYSTFAQGIIRVTKREIPVVVWIFLSIFISLLVFYVYIKTKVRKRRYR